MKKITRLFLMFLMLIPATCISAAKTFPLAELVNPVFMTGDDYNIYIMEKVSVLIYSLKDFKLIKRFGKKGEGPGEFKVSPDEPIALCVLKDELMVRSKGRFSYFSKKGEFIRETRTKPGYVMTLQPHGDQFLGVGTVNEDMGYITLNIYDNRFNKVKEVYRIKEELQLTGKRVVFHFLQLPPALATSFASYRGHIYLTWGKDDKLKIFDSTGKPVRTISPLVEKIPLSAAYKDKVRLHYKNDPDIPTPIYQRMYKNMVCPEFFPAIRDLRVEGDKIYLATYQRRKDKSLTLIYDLKGKLLEKIYLPLLEMDTIRFYPYFIRHGLLYQLSEDENEEFRLHTTRLNR